MGTDAELHAADADPSQDEARAAMAIHNVCESAAAQLVRQTQVRNWTQRQGRCPRPRQGTICRDELEINDRKRLRIEAGTLHVEILGEGTVWPDTKPTSRGPTPAASSASSKAAKGSRPPAGTASVAEGRRLRTARRFFRPHATARLPRCRPVATIRHMGLAAGHTHS